jgi:hypothetical protein
MSSRAPKLKTRCLGCGKNFAYTLYCDACVHTVGNYDPAIVETRTGMPTYCKRHNGVPMPVTVKDHRLEGI